MISPIIRFIYYKAFKVYRVNSKDPDAFKAYGYLADRYELKMKMSPDYFLTRWNIQNVIEILKNEK